jgi:hypothetical protein
MASDKPHQPDQAAANSSAIAREEKPTTTTEPENARDDARSRQRQAPADSAEPTSTRQQGADRGTPPKPRPLATTAREETEDHIKNTPKKSHLDHRSDRRDASPAHTKKRKKREKKKTLSIKTLKLGESRWRALRAPYER